MVSNLLSALEGHVYLRMSAKNICYFSIATHLGGAERSLLELLSCIKNEKKIKMFILLPQGTGPLLQELSQVGLLFDVLPMPNVFLKTSRSAPLRSVCYVLISLPALVVYGIKLRAYFKKNKINIIHTTGIKCHFLSALTTIGLKLKIIWHLRDIFTAGLTKAALQTFYKLGASKITLIANSKATANSFLSDPSIFVVLNGIDTSQYFERPNRCFQTNDKADPPIPIVGILGVIARWKGQREFIEMAGLVLKRHKDVNFVIIGDQIYDTAGDRGLLSELKVRVSELGIGNQVFFVGFKKNTVEALNGLTILVHASIRPEPFGRVLLEAQSCGIPVVASAAGGVLEIIEDGKNGLLFAPGSIEEMAACVCKLLENSALAKKIAQAGLQHVNKNFTLNRHAQQIISIYDKVGA